MKIDNAVMLSEPSKGCRTKYIQMRPRRYGGIDPARDLAVGAAPTRLPPVTLGGAASALPPRVLKGRTDVPRTSVRSSGMNLKLLDGWPS